MRRRGVIGGIKSNAATGASAFKEEGAASADKASVNSVIVEQDVSGVCKIYKMNSNIEGAEAVYKWSSPSKAENMPLRIIQSLLSEALEVKISNHGCEDEVFRDVVRFIKSRASFSGIKVKILDSPAAQAAPAQAALTDLPELSTITTEPPDTFVDFAPIRVAISLSPKPSVGDGAMASSLTTPDTRRAH